MSIHGALFRGACSQLLTHSKVKLTCLGGQEFAGELQPTALQAVNMSIAIRKIYICCPLFSLAHVGEYVAGGRGCSQAGHGRLQGQGS